MEKNLAILIADLSGYTALTEAHGAISAADLIETFLKIVGESLVGDSHLHQRRGDEVMIISESPDNLLSTALLLLRNSAKENFLLLHGGLHYGPVLERESEYFGSAINFTARIAAKASAGTFCCSREFHDAIENPKLCAIEPMGTHELKNIMEEKEIFQVIITDQANFLAIDPVCRMLILSEQKAIPHPHERDVFFCSENCLNIYESKQMSKNEVSLR
jgi:adenylate cyclase